MPGTLLWKFVRMQAFNDEFLGGLAKRTMDSPGNELSPVPSLWSSLG